MVASSGSSLCVHRLPNIKYKNENNKEENTKEKNKLERKETK